MEITIIITFEEIEDPERSRRTKMTLHYSSIEGIEGKMLEDMTQGWNQSFDKIVEALK